MSDLMEVWEPRLAQWLEEARELRGALEVPAVEDGPHALHRQLIQARRALDRIEVLLASAIRLKGKAGEALLAARRKLRDAEDQALQNRSKAFDQYVSTRERLAWLAGQTEVEQKDLEDVEMLDAQAQTALEELRLMHRGVDAVRRDVDTRLRLMSVETRLER